MLNSDFSALSVISWQRAMVLMYINSKDKDNGVNAVEYYNEYIQATGQRKFPIPAVVRRVSYLRSHNKKLPFSRKNVFIRDKLTCGYCGKKYPPKELTYDHIIPRAKHKKQNHKCSPTNYLNIVTCCIKCNRKKANRTPKEAKMTLLHDVKEPNPRSYVLGFTPWGKIPPEWMSYLPNNYKEIIEALK